MPMPVDERVRKASAARTRNARERRFRGYAGEMEAAEVPADVLDRLANILRQNGRTSLVTP